MIRSLLLVSASLLALAACKNGTMQQEVPAVIHEPTAEARAELQSHVSSALATDVLLADDALSESSVLIVERRVRRDPAGNRLPGRDLGRPEEFQLLLSGGNCVLVRQSTGERWKLREVNCVPEEARSNSPNGNA